MVNEFYSYGDGSSLYLIDISDRLKKLGYHISILYGTKREKPVEDSEIESFYVPGVFGFNYLYGDDAKKRIIEIVNAVDPQIIYIHQVLNPHVIDLLATLRPSIRFEHGFRLSCFTGRRMSRTGEKICDYSPGLSCLLRAHTQKCSPRNPLLAFKRIKDFYLNKKSHDKLARIIVASKYIKNLLLKSGYRDNHVEVIPYYTILPEQSRRNDLLEVPKIICVSRLEAEKGIDYLIKALSMVPIKAKIFIIGEGPHLPKLKQIVKSLSLKHKIIFTGWVENNKLTNFYSQASVAVVPSIWPEPFGIIGLEAMANQVPVVAFDVGGISDWLINGETGFLVPAKDVKRLAGKINYILDNPNGAEKMGKNGRALVKEKFIASTHINALLTVFEQAFEDFSKGLQ
jgi:glycosyltransferase involved in cell wall biosynthesis